MSEELWRALLQPGTKIEIETCGTFLRTVVTAKEGMGACARCRPVCRSTAIMVDLPVNVRAVEYGKVRAD